MKPRLNKCGDMPHHRSLIAGLNRILRPGFAVGFLLAHGFSAGESASTFDHIIASMTFDVFWKIIDDARYSTQRASEIPDWLVEHLSRLDERDIADFQTHLGECMHRSYDAHLWLGAVVVLGGCGDDSFDYFRAWLISQGRGAFESALADTDSMAAFESFDGEYGIPRLERILSAASKAFLKRVGGDDFAAQERFESLLPSRQHPPLRNRELVSTSDEGARVLLPRLAARFPISAASRRER